LAVSTWHSTKSSIDDRYRNHILEDLEPYLCHIEGCANPRETYRSHSQAKKHVALSHGNLKTVIDKSSCIFCGNSAGTGEEAYRHMYRHMEEIAFAVVPRLYEDWSFYSDSDSQGSSSEKQKTGQEKALNFLFSPCASHDTFVCTCSREELEASGSLKRRCKFEDQGRTRKPRLTFENDKDLKTIIIRD
jgi:hypothetical protein